MRALAGLLAVAFLLPGCVRQEDGPRLVVVLSDQENDIDDFRHLNVTIERVVLFRVTGTSTRVETETETEEEVPEDPYGVPKRSTRTERSETTSEDTVRATLEVEERADLTRLRGANETVLFNGSVAEGTYKRVELHVTDAVGVLRDGREILVDVPSGRLFLEQRFEVAEGVETTFLFDVSVHELGNGEYQLRPNAGESGARVRR